MYNRDPAPRHWRSYLWEMIQFSERVLQYADGLDRENLQAAGPVYDAILWNIALIGEAANNIPVAIRQTRPAIPWREIVATRNNLVHHYFGIDHNTVWEIIEVNIPTLLPQLRALLESAEEQYFDASFLEEPL